MRLVKVHIEGFRNLDDVTLEFPEAARGFSAIVGPNACGKTSILEAIALGMGAVSHGRGASPLRGRPPEKLGLEFDRGSKFEFLGTGQGRSDLNPGQLERLRNNVLLLPSNRDPRVAGQTITPGKPSTFDTALAVSPRVEDTVTRSEILHRRIVSRQLAAVRDNMLWDALRPFLGGTEFQDVDPASFDLRFRTRTGTVTFNQLSSGQRQLVFTFAEILMHCGPEGLLLMDEPEAHLHPAWQRLLPQALQTLLPRGQVIVATHSPYVVHGLQPEQLFVLGEVDAATPVTP